MIIPYPQKRGNLFACKVPHGFTDRRNKTADTPSKLLFLVRQVVENEAAFWRCKERKNEF
jgi:hypothetical protein